MAEDYKRKSNNSSNNNAVKQLPFSIEAEQQLIGCILFNNTIATDIVMQIPVEAFYLEANKYIYQAIISLNANGSVIDIATVSDYLIRTNTFEKAGGMDYISKLASFMLSSAYVKDYIAIVKRNYILRNLIETCSDIIGDAYSQQDYQSALADAEKKIYDLSQADQHGDLVPVSESFAEVMHQIDQISKNKDVFKGIMTGFWKLDQITNGLHGGELIVIAARPGEGKSSLAMNIVERAAKDGKSCAVFSLEMPKNQIAHRLLCSCAGISLSKVQSAELSDSQWTDLYNTLRALDKLKIFIDDSSLNTPPQLLSKCRRLKSQVGLDLIMVDYIQLMSSGNKKVENRQQDVSEITRNLKIIAKELNVPIIALSQMSRQIDARKESTPMLSDLRESGAIEQDADIVMFIYKDKQDVIISGNAQKRMLSVAKHRNGELCEIPLKWIGEHVRFQNMTSQDFDYVKQAQEMAKNKNKDSSSSNATQNLSPAISDQLSDLPKSVIIKNLEEDIPPINNQDYFPGDYDLSNNPDNSFDHHNDQNDYSMPSIDDMPMIDDVPVVDDILYNNNTTSDNISSFTGELSMEDTPNIDKAIIGGNSSDIDFESLEKIYNSNFVSKNSKNVKTDIKAPDINITKTINDIKTHENNSKNKNNETIDSTLTDNDEDNGQLDY